MHHLENGVRLVRNPNKNKPWACFGQRPDGIFFVQTVVGRQEFEAEDKAAACANAHGAVRFRTEVEARQHFAE